jgi:predicted small metal-binding protein
MVCGWAVGAPLDGRAQMKRFACGDVVPGCRSEWTAEDDDALLALVAGHARDEHGLAEVPAELVEQVRSRIVTVG